MTATFRYATYTTRAKAEAALEDMYASGDVFECEVAAITKRDTSYNACVNPTKYVWDILLRA